MQVIRNLVEAGHIQSPTIRTLVEHRINDLGGEAFDATALGYFLVVERSDTLDALATQLGFSLLANRMTHIRYENGNVAEQGKTCNC